MTKKGMATLMHLASTLGQCNEFNNQMSIEVIQNSFSALATSNPKLAISLIGELNKQIPAMEEQARDMANKRKEFIDEMVPKMADNLELESEEDDDIH